MKAAMTSDFTKIKKLSLANEKINYLNFGNSTLQKLKNIVKLDLSFNQIVELKNLDTLRALQELDLSGNPIKVMDNINMPLLKSLTMDSCKLKKIENLKNVKKL